MASSWDKLGQVASVMQVTGVDAFGLVSMIVQAAHTARRNRDLCQQLAQHVQIVGDLLRRLEIPELKRHPETRRPLEQLDAALFRAYKLVRYCSQQQEKASQLYQMFTGGDVASKLRHAQEEIDRFINLIPMVTAVAVICTRDTKEAYDGMTNDTGPHTQRPRLSLQEVTESLALEEMPTRGEPTRNSWPLMVDNVRNGLPSRRRHLTDGVSSSELRSISDRIPGNPLQVPTSLSRFLFSLQPSRNGPLNLSPFEGLLNLSLEHVVKVTHNFSPTLMIGEGYFGKVYRAELRDGHVVALQRAKKEHFFSLCSELSNEIALLETIEHRNLVKLLGYIDEGSERILIYEYVSNGTLREHLDGEHGLVLGFNQRLQIAIDVSHGLTYLHLCAEKPIIHKGVTSSNILLNEAFRAKVFFYRLEVDMRGTAGYAEPEYLMTNHPTTKSDVFSYGILLLEILTGRRPIEVRRDARERITVRWAFTMYAKGEVKDILDPMLTEAVNEDVLNNLFDLAFQCVAPTRNDRPQMKEVAERLWKIRMDFAKTQRTAEVVLLNSETI